jgi:hypothetical protein
MLFLWNEDTADREGVLGRILRMSGTVVAGPDTSQRNRASR